MWMQVSTLGTMRACVYYSVFQNNILYAHLSNLNRTEKLSDAWNHGTNE
jgi:hypothetical protein